MLKSVKGGSFSGDFEVTISSRGVMLPIVDDPILPTLSLQGLGCRYLSALTMSALTNMPIVVVSQEDGTVTMLRRGEVVREFSPNPLSSAAAFLSSYVCRLLIRQAEGEVCLGLRRRPPNCLDCYRMHHGVIACSDGPRIQPRRGTW